MTMRDHKLLALALAALAVLITVQGLFLPSLETEQTLNTEYGAIALERQNQQSRIQALSYLDDAIAQHEAAFDQASAPYYGYLSTEEMDGVVTDLLLRHDLLPRRLQLQQGVTGKLTDYLAPGLSRAEEAAYGEVYDGVSLAELKEEGTAAAMEDREILYIARAELTAQGSRTNFLALLDDVAENYPGLRIVSFTIDGEEDPALISCDLELYLCGR